MISRLYDEIPGFDCVPECSECCGPVPCHDWEIENIGLKNAVSIGTSGLKTISPTKCQFIEDGKCSIYDHRPLMCRLFGTVEALKCPHGKGPEQLLTGEQAAGIMDKYTGLFK
jgi:Fe-S-cluster containining protein